ncbi:MAG: ATP-binding protein [Patescibacteria group bacterium]
MSRVFGGLRGRILLGYALLVAIIALVGAWAIYNFAHLNRVLTDITRENYRSVLAVQNMVGAIERQDSAELLLLLGEVRGGTDIYQEGQREFRRWLDVEERNITLPGEGVKVSEIVRDYRAYDRLFDTLRDMMANERRENARRTYLVEIEPLFKRIRVNLGALLEMNNRALLDGNQRSKHAAWRATISTALVSSVSIILGIFLGLGVSGAVVRPTLQLTGAVRRIREGNLDERVSVDSSDEIGELAREFNRMVLRLRHYEESLTGKVAAEQQKALAIVNAIDDAVILTDGAQQVVMLNPAAESILGINGADVAERDVLQVTGQPVIQTMVAKALSGEMPHNRTVVMKIGGEERFFDAEVVPLRAAADAAPGLAVSGTVVLLKDITYHKRLEKMKSDFLSEVSHEIRTPLTSIAMGLGLLQESKVLAEQNRDREILDMVGEETTRLTTLVEDLLALSRLESGRTPLTLQTGSLAELFETATAPFHLQAEAGKIEFFVQTEPGLPAVRMDQAKIRTVVANLLTNAFRYTPAGGRISLTAAKNGEAARVAVSDTGPGIPADVGEKVFDRFFQMKERPGGQAGLGLPICKAIVEAHGGRIWLESGDGPGAAFVFEIPLAGPRPAATENKE